MLHSYIASRSGKDKMDQQEEVKSQDLPASESAASPPPQSVTSQNESTLVLAVPYRRLNCGQICNCRCSDKLSMEKLHLLICIVPLLMFMSCVYLLSSGESADSVTLAWVLVSVLAILLVAGLISLMIVILFQVFLWLRSLCFWKLFVGRLVNGRTSHILKSLQRR